MNNGNRLLSYGSVVLLGSLAGCSGGAPAVVPDSPDASSSAEGAAGRDAAPGRDAREDARGDSGSEGDTGVVADVTSEVMIAADVATGTPGHRIVTTTTIPLAGPSRVLGQGKEYDFARMNGRWYKMAGDHAAIDANSPDVQGGRQEILSFSLPANDWREDQPYYAPGSTKVQGTDPDDAFVIVRDKEVFYFYSDSNHGITQPSGDFAQQIQPNAMLMAWTPPAGGAGDNGSWREVAAWPWLVGSDRAWRGIYDPVKDNFFIPINKEGAAFCVVDGASGADLTTYTSPGVPATYGDQIFSLAGVAADFDKRKAYLYDIATSNLWQVDLDTFALVKAADVPEPPHGTESIIKLIWDPDLRAVVLASDNLYVYEVDSAAMTIVPRPDGFTNGVGTYVPAQAIFFDPDTHNVITIGTMDWDTNMNPGVFWSISIR